MVVLGKVQAFGIRITTFVPLLNTFTILLYWVPLYKTMLHTRQTLLCTSTMLHSRNFCEHQQCCTADYSVNKTMLHSRLFCDIKAICERTIDPCNAPTPHRRLVSTLLPTFVKKMCKNRDPCSFVHFALWFKTILEPTR